MRPFAFPLAAVSAICAAGLLQGCRTAPPPAPLATAPVLRLSDGDGDNPGYAYRLGREYERRGDLVRASTAYARSLSLDPAQLDARNAQAVLLAKQGDLPQAADLLRKLAADFPTQAQPLSNLGYVYHLQGNDTQADTTLRAALALAPDHVAARANLALLAAPVVSAAPAATAAPVATAPRAAAPAARAMAATAPVPAATTPSAAAAPSAAPAAPFSLTTTPHPQWQLLQVAPNEFRLQAPPAPAAAAPVTAPATAPGTAPVATPAAGGESAPERLQIVNGFGAPGVATKARDLLRRHGFAAASVTNQRGYRQAQTVIEYVPGQQARARALRAALPGTVTLAPVPALPRQLTLRLVLGQDHDRAPTPNLLARLERPAPAFNQESP
jgi:hypothetical protein